VGRTQKSMRSAPPTARVSQVTPPPPTCILSAELPSLVSLCSSAHCVGRSADPISAVMACRPVLRTSTRDET
jgi:hypothetical protein